MDESDMDSEQPVILEGIVSVQAALQASSRPIHTILIQQGKHSRAISSLERAAAAQGIVVQRVDESVIAGYVTGHSHGGVMALAGERRFVGLADLIADVPCPFVALLDGIEDPFNLGASVRALYAAGAHGLVTRPRSWTSAAGVVARSSGGASERIPTAVAETVQDAALFFKSQGLAIACAAKNNSVSIYQADLTIPLFLVIGGEKRGITRAFEDQADLRLQIPYGRPFTPSLGTTSAVAVLAFEVMHQRAALSQR